MTVNQISIGRFHHFHLARQLERHSVLESIWTGYPRYKLRDESGIPASKIKTFPWLQVPYMARGRVGLSRWAWLNKEWAWWGRETLDLYTAANIKRSSPTTIIALSGSGLYAGKTAQRNGGFHICDRGSSHIRFQDQILREEYARWGLTFSGVDPRIIAKEEAEYEQADLITVPSDFVKNSFVTMGVPEYKLRKVVYGARLERFKKVADPPKDLFRVLWVGAVSIRKGFFDLLDAFQSLKHSKKELLVVGVITPEIKSLLIDRDLTGVTFLGVVSNQALPQIYSSSHVFVLPSVEEGLAMVQGEALACGCPIIASTNTGAEDIITNGKEGFIIPIRSSNAILEKLRQLAEDPDLQNTMSYNAVERVQALGGWDTYGTNFVKVLNCLPAK